MHPNLIHPNQSLPLSHSYPPRPTGPAHQASKRRPEDDEEIVAKKKKNADAQAAFRLRRQTYIKSLEDTVSELKNAVSEMEVLVKTANHDVKLQRERVAFLDAKLKQAGQNPGETLAEGSSHCTCCRYAPPPLDQAAQHPNRHPTSASTASLINPTTPTVPTPVSTPALTPQTIHHPRDWPTQRSYPSVFVSQPHAPRPNSPQQPGYNRTLQRQQTNEPQEQSGNSAYGQLFFEPFTTSTPTTTAFYHPSMDIHHHHHHSSSPPVDSPRPTAYLGVHQQPTSRTWQDYGIEQQQKQSYKHDETRYYADDQQHQPRRRRDEEGAGITKLNGLPAKVARCNQAVMEVSKVVEQAKLATAAGVSPSKFEFGGSGVV